MITYMLQKVYMGVSKNSSTPKSSILIGFSIIFTIHFGGKPPIFGNTYIPKNHKKPQGNGGEFNDF